MYTVESARGGAREKGRSNSLTTLECAILAAGQSAVTLNGVDAGRGRAAVDGENFCWSEAAAAIDNPTLDRREARGARRKIEEYSLVVLFFEASPIVPNPMDEG